MTQPTAKLSRERLLAQEHEDPALRADYERRLNAMLEVPLSTPRRTSAIVVLVGAAGMAVLLAALLVTESAAPWQTRSAFAVGTVFAAAWAAYALRLLRRGTYHRKLDSTTAANMAWTFTIITAVTFALLTRDKDPFVIFCFLFLLPAAVILLRTATEQSEIRTHERLLELEYKLAQLGESLSNRTK